MYILLVWPILPKHCLKIWNVTYTQYEGTDLIWRLVLLKVMHIRAVQDISWLSTDRFTHKIARFVFPCLQSFQITTTKNTHICVSTEYFRCTDIAEFPINTVPKLSKWSLHPSDKNLNVNVFRDKSLFQVQRFPSKRSSCLSRNTKKTHLWGLMKYKKTPCSNKESISYLLMRSIKSQPLCAHIYFFNNLFNEIKIDRTLSALRTRNDFQGSLLAEPSRERQVSWYDSMRWGGWAVRE